MKKKRIGYQIFTGSTLKIIAMAVMLIDHIAAALLAIGPLMGILGGLHPERIMSLYMVMRNIGRTAFPIFCFLLVEGFSHTGSRKKYVRNLLLFALLSEIPFDLALTDGLTLGVQNVYFTLLIGVLVMWALESMEAWRKTYKAAGIALMILTLALGCFAAEWINADYGMAGVALIVILYFLRNNRLIAGICGYVSLYAMEPWCFPAFLLIQLYNGERGLKLKYVFYLFYPVHLCILYAIRMTIIWLT